MRLFIAVPLPELVVEECCRVLELVKAENILANWVPRQNMHITMLFLGEVQKTQLKQLKAQLSTVSMPAFQARIAKPGVFSPDFIRVVWLGVKAQQLLALHVKSCEALGRNYKRSFYPHITLARVKAIRDRRGFLQKLDKIQVKPISFKVSSFKLMSSTNGLKYEVVKDYRLHKS